MGLLNWIRKDNRGQRSRLSQSQHSQHPTFEQLEPRILLSGDGLLASEPVIAGSDSDQLVGFPDVLATLAELTGTSLPEGSFPDSYSFLPVLLGDQPENQPVRPVWLMESANGTMVIRSGKWKLISRLGSGGFSKPGLIEPGPGDPEGQLYDLVKDPGESSNLYLERPDVVQRLLAELEQLTREED